jgi:hypothetical protein
MKRILLTILSLSLFTIAFGQKVTPEIKKGTIFICTAYVSGQEVPLILTIKSMANPLSIGWSVEGYGEGSFDMSDKAVEKADKMEIPSQPSLGVTKLADDVTFVLISKAAYKSLIDTKMLSYNGMKFKAKSPVTPMKIGDKELNVTHIVSENGKYELWVLNNPDLPLVLQTAGLPTDLVVTEIK